MKIVVITGLFGLLTLPVSAEIKMLSDESLSDIQGQSGLVIEAGFGTVFGVVPSVDPVTGKNTSDYYGVDWSAAGIQIDAFKWIVDIEGGWDQTSNTGVNVYAGNPVEAYAGFIARDIAIAGQVDVTIDATADLAAVLGSGGFVSESDGGIGITFSNSFIHFRVGDMGIFVEEYDLAYAGGAGIVAAQQVSSFGGIEMLGMDIDGLELVIRGNGL